MPTAASPSSTSLTLLLGFGAEDVVESVIGEVEVVGGSEGCDARRLRPTLDVDTLYCAVGSRGRLIARCKK